jgi:hypothetical protein
MNEFITSKRRGASETKDDRCGSGVDRYIT